MASIDDIIKAEDRILRDSFHDIFDVLSVPYSIFDVEASKYILTNTSFEKFTGLTKEEISAHEFSRWKLWTHEEDYAILEDQVEEDLMDLYKQHVHDPGDKLSYLLNVRRKALNEGGKFDHYLIQSNIIQWSSEHKPKLILDIYTNVNKRKFTNKIVLSVSKFDRFNNRWNEIHNSEYIRDPEMLGKRESQVLFMILNGLSASEVAKRLKISFYTVRAHWRNILLKTNTTSKDEVRMLALEHGWL